MILFIEDERMYNESYIEALEEAGYQIHFERNIERSIAFLKSNVDNIELVILDIMFSLPESLPLGMNKSKTMDGRRAGVEILRLLNEVPGGGNIPKIILTNVAAEDFHATYSQSEEVKRCLKKMNTLPSELVKIVEDIVHGGK